MSDTKSAIDVMSAEETALLDEMRDDAAPDAPEAVETPEPDATVDLAADDDGSAEEAPDATGEPPPKGSAKARIQGAIAKQRAAEARAIEAERKAAVSEGVVAERLRLLTEAATAAMPKAVDPAAPAPIEVPDEATDPVGHFKALREIDRRELESMKAVLTGFTENQRQAQAQAEMRSWGIAQENAFAAKEPAYAEAMTFLTAKRREQMEAIGITDPAQQQQILFADITNIAQKTRMDQQADPTANFGERLFKVAKSFGFAPKPAAPVLPPLDAAVDLPARATRIEQGRDNSTTIADAGRPAPRALTPTQIGEMSEHQFAAYYAKILDDPTKLRELLGS